MAAKPADNYKEAGDILVWTNLGADTATMYKYTCPVNSHKILAPIRLGYKSDNSTYLTDAKMRCPVHDVGLGDGTAVSIT